MTRHLTSSHILLGALAVSGVMLLASPAAQAQGVGITDAAKPNLIGGDRPKGPGKRPDPAALPGAQSTGDDAARRAGSDLPPTEALFDAIDRGDITTARDAVGRGADLNAPNVLGLTALDLSVDLGRNDITFLLLSLRGSVAPAEVVVPKSGTPTRGAKIVAASKPVTKPASRGEAARQPASAPLRQYVSTDPGTPAPQAGFLGFNAPGK